MNRMENRNITSSQDDEIEIDLGALFHAILSRLHIVILFAVMIALLAFIGTRMLITPKYTSETKVYVLNKSNSESGVTNSDLQAGTYLTNDYAALVKSRKVMEETISQLGLENTTAEALMKKVSVETATDSRIMTIKVTDTDPKEAQEIANAVRECASTQITEIMDADAVNTVEEANLPENPSSPNTKKNMLLGAVIGALLAIVIIVIRQLMDDTICTKEDIEKYLGLSTLALIPIAEGEAGKKKRKKKKM